MCRTVGNCGIGARRRSRFVAWVGEPEEGGFVLGELNAKTLHVARHAVEVGFEDADADVGPVRFFAAARNKRNGGDPNRKNPKSTHPRIHSAQSVTTRF